MSRMLNVPIVAFDFDETLTNVGYSALNLAYQRGEDLAIYANQALIDTLTRLHNDGCVIIVWTCRHTKEDMWIVKEFLKRMEVYHKINYINENPPELVKRYGDSRKVFADYYIDNANVLMYAAMFGDYYECEGLYHFIVDHDDYYKTNFSRKGKVKK